MSLLKNPRPDGKDENRSTSPLLDHVTKQTVHASPSSTKKSQFPPLMFRKTPLSLSTAHPAAKPAENTPAPSKKVPPVFKDAQQLPNSPWAANNTLVPQQHEASPEAEVASPVSTQSLFIIEPRISQPLSKKTDPLRDPMVIRGSWLNIPTPLPLSHNKQRRLLFHISIATFLVLIVLVTLVVAPLNNDRQGTFTSFQASSHILRSGSTNAGLIAQQAATATAVTQDGYDPGANYGQFAGVAPAPVLGGGGLNRFFFGQCTYWANMHYHDLTGIWIPWLGNAAQWVSGAAESGWVVSGTPHVSSIIVLQPWVQGAGFYGHVAVVEKINPDGSVVTSNWNWAGNWNHTTYVTFYPGPGVSFVWANGH